MEPKRGTPQIALVAFFDGLPSNCQAGNGPQSIRASSIPFLAAARREVRRPAFASDASPSGEMYRQRTRSVHG